MLGIHFENCNPIALSFNFTNCILNLSSFYKLHIIKTKFIDCKMEEVDFSDCNLEKSEFNSSDLLGAIFENSNLKKVDFRTANNYNIDPEINNIKGAKFSLPSVIGVLNKYNIEIEI